MKSSSLRSFRSGLSLGTVLGLAVSLGAQSSGNSGRPSIPPADKLVLLGQVSTAAEAKPLIEKYYAEQEELFQERRAAILRMQGKSKLEQLQIMQALVESQQERRKKNKELEAKVSAMLKQEREDKATARTGQ